MSRVSLEQCTRDLLNEYFDCLSDSNGAHNLHKLVIEQVEKPLIEEVLKQTRGNKLQSAKILGINRNTLHKKIKYFKIT